MADRLVTLEAELVRHGAADGARARRFHDMTAAALGADPRRWAGWEDELEDACDVDQALSAMADVSAAAPEATRSCLAEPDHARRLIRLLGASTELGRHLAAHPEDLAQVVADPRAWTAEDLREDLLATVEARPDGSGLLVAGADPTTGADALRLANRRHLVRIACRDLDRDDPTTITESIAAELADLADAVVETALALARAATPGHDAARLAILAMGKCGARELNYISDVDVIHVVAPTRDDVSSSRAVEVGQRLAAAVARICSAHSAAGSIWQVDAALRPEGDAGPLVRTLESMGEYYRSWARNWEFQALLKARPMAGDRQLGEDFCSLVAPLVWKVGEQDGFVAQTRAMRTRVVDHIPRRDRDREIKLGPGGLRDVEFTAQLLQLVHGRQDASLRVRSTFDALRALSAGGYIGRADANRLLAAYRLERTLEHRVQLYRLRRTHLLPEAPEDLRRLARAVGLHRAEDVRDLWRTTSRSVLRTHNRVFYSPLVEAVSRIPSEELRMTTQAAQVRLRALGFHDEASALRHIEALTQGTSRSVRIQAQLMPAMLGWLAEGPNPDHGLLAFRQVSEGLGTSPWYLRALRDEGAMAQRLAAVLSGSRLAVDMLVRAPDTVQVLTDDDLAPRDGAEVRTEMLRVARRHPEVADAVRAIRAVRRRELFRVLVDVVLGIIDVEAAGRALSDLAGATVDAALDAVSRTVENPPRIGVVAMGRWGGAELSLGSDADAMFVVEDGGPQAVAAATEIVARLRTLLAAPGPEPRLDLDAGLRPEGRSGPLVRTLSSYRSYYAGWSSTWESQALLRAAHGAGDEDLTGALVGSVAHLRWPADGLDPAQRTQVRRLKARMEKERVKRGTDPRLDVKMGPGGLADVEWTVQMMQLDHAGQMESLRTTSTLAALDAAHEAGLVDLEQTQALRAAWIDASRLRNAIVCVRGRAGDVMPSDSGDLDAVARIMGLGPGASELVVENHLRSARRAGKVVEAIFWGS
ncbi:bifunctional [glutamine synthetase] adenylyltransferase/[glutamine synthetase]-adenylyl-L-tyrosine phosphorylase [Acidipropionibacterium timonense]|uniref:bifunctional [glutamine synthetase] adenylyltransferase/[glutamine synthetase]-adenylyl-L-tyrosine phosphorylase n=1 Tax=Acidipropionibacterium timonense TaxID=2161818 RepID=UPI0010324F99|nr:bifunctional [glutamine synthetase] adenylyltransferase/[glutamine synthetase]-adenylyl-L-tyrosine phosphorylase [Acidipropionibacterium timonense]